MKKFRLCYLSRNYKGMTNAGYKAKTDYEDILKGMEAYNLGWKRTFFKSTIITFILNLTGVIRSMFVMKKNDVIVLQYPVKKYFVFLCRVAHKHNAFVIAFIHDLGSFRREKITVKKEIWRLNHADYVIAANDSMKSWLIDKGCFVKIGEMGFHDYLMSSQPKIYHHENEFRIIYAGELSIRKNAFLLELPHIVKNFRLDIYGRFLRIPTLKQSAHINVHTFLPPKDFIKTVEGDFGLVWDGDSTSGCTGNFGEYLKYNTPHKASFYLRSGLPLIVWKQSAIAMIVEKEGIGITINSLDELNTILPAITNEQMAEMRKNVHRVSIDISNGNNFKKALNYALESLR